MGYSEALKNVGTSYDKNAIFFDPNGNKSDNAVDFGRFIRERQSAGAAEDTESTAAAIHGKVGNDAAVEMLSAMARMSDPYSLEELDFFDGNEGLDTALDLDEIAELDEIADDLAAQVKAAEGNDVFGNTNVFDEDITDTDIDDDLATFEMPDELM